jgi:hypothetical protein
MDALAHQLTKYSIWVLPVVWLVLGGVAWPHHRLSAVFLLLAGLTATLWNFLFMHVDSGHDSQQYWNAVVLVPFDDAPVGHILATYLPLLSKACLVIAFVGLFRHEV